MDTKRYQRPWRVIATRGHDADFRSRVVTTYATAIRALAYVDSPALQAWHRDRFGEALSVEGPS